MSYTVADGIPQGNPWNQVGFLRQALIAEIIAINGYRIHIAMSPIIELNEIWHEIMEAEKRHYGMFLDLIRKYDREQYEQYLKAKEKINITNTTLPKCIFQADSCYLNLVRDDIKGENEAILLYEQNLSNISFSDIRDVYREVIKDEKFHIEELTAAMIQYDKQPYGPITN